VALHGGGGSIIIFWRWPSCALVSSEKLTLGWDKSFELVEGELSD